MLREEVGMRVRCANKASAPNSSENLQKARYLWVLRTPQNNKEEGARARELVTCGTRGPLGRGQSVPFSAQGAYCSAPEPKEALTGQELPVLFTLPLYDVDLRTSHAHALQPAALATDRTGLH